MARWYMLLLLLWFSVLTQTLLHFKNSDDKTINHLQIAKREWHFRKGVLEVFCPPLVCSGKRRWRNFGTLLVYMKLTSIFFAARGRLKGGGGTFLDRVHLHVRGGSGGQGLARLGGIGGDGGDVILVVKKNSKLEDLYRLNPRLSFIAKSGEHSRKLCLVGERGKNYLIPVPPGIVISGTDGNVLAELNESGERLIVAKGGQGGSAKSDYASIPPVPHSICLDLKLLADVGLVGFPNAGKSTLLKSISNAKPKIASYPFTTVRPQLGQVEFPDLRKFTVADLPGLIEGAHKNVGMGHRFLMHVERTRIMLLVIDIHGFQLNRTSPFRDAFETLMLLTKEIELYKSELVHKPAVLCINKMDSPVAKDKLAEILEKVNAPDVYKDSVEEFMRPKKCLTFEDVIPISAKNPKATEELKNRLREIIDTLDDRIRDRRRRSLNNLPALHSEHHAVDSCYV